MTTATLIQSSEGLSIEFCTMVTGRPTWDVQTIAALLTALGVRNLDLRVHDGVDMSEMLAHHRNVLDAVHRHRRGIGVGVQNPSTRRL